jgi:hypothetical protein
VVGCTIGSRGGIPGERKPVIRDDIIIIIIIRRRRRRRRIFGKGLGFFSPRHCIQSGGSSYSGDKAARA